MITVVGLTPTVQRTLFFRTFHLGAVNRAKETLVTASGKAVNVARVLTTLSAPANLIHILGGSSGRFVSELLDREEIPHQTIEHENNAPTRTCTTLLVDNGATTELVEEAQAVGIHDVKLLFAAAQNSLLSSKTLVCSGSLPPEVPDDFYARLVREANGLGIPSIVDAQKAPLRAALAEKPFLVKPNIEETAATLGLTLTGNREQDAQTACAELIAAGAEWALVSMGKEGAYLMNRHDNLWFFKPPKIDVINPIGSGDSLCAGFVAAHFVRGMTVPEAVAFGTACAAANCLTPTSGVVHTDDVERLLPSVEWKVA